MLLNKINIENGFYGKSRFRKNKEENMCRIHYKLVVFLLMAFFTLVVNSVSADVAITQVKLASKGINTKAFFILGPSADGRIVTGYEKITDPKIIAKGYAFKFWIIEFQGDDREKVKFDEIPLPITDFQQAWLSHDGKTQLITAERGAKFLKVDIPSKKVTVLFDHKKGVPGFRSEVGLIEYFNGKFYVWGYFYNDKDEETERGMAEVDLTKSGPDMFKMAYNTKEFEKLPAWYTEWVSPSSCFIILKYQGKKEDTLSFYDNGKIKPLDKSWKYHAEAAAANRVVYSLNRDKNVIDTMLIDAVQGKTWKLASGDKVYSYMFIAREKGETVIVSLVDLAKAKMSLFYAMEKDDFKLKPISAIQNKPVGVVRLAAYGKIYVVYTGSEIYWGKLE